jgi:hypothetical protein
MTEDERDYFKEKIKAAAEFIDGRSKLINQEYSLKVAELAQRFPDDLARQTIRETMDPKVIARRVHKICSLLQLDRLKDADWELEELQHAINFVDTKLKKPLFELIIKISDGRITGGEVRGAQQTIKAAAAWKSYTDQYERLLSGGAEYLKARNVVTAKMKNDGFLVPSTGEFPTEKTIRKWLPKK